MNDYYLKKLAASIAQDGEIKGANAQRVLKTLSLKDLKKFLSFLKTELLKSTVEVSSSDKLVAETKQLLAKKFQGKHLVEKVDENLGAGMMVKSYDMIYDLTVMGSIKEIAQKIEDTI
ncbi:MAG: F0F1 ATP synthase subunit delta [Candidatus Levyibacteriota bacterium]